MKATRKALKMHDFITDLQLLSVREKNICEFLLIYIHFYSNDFSLESFQFSFSNIRRKSHF